MTTTTYTATNAEVGSKTCKRLRVCHVAYTFYEEDNRVTRYAKTFSAAGHHVEVIALRRSGQARESEYSGVRVLRIQRREVTERSALTYLLKIVTFIVRATLVISARHLRTPYDIVHVHNVPDFLVFAALLPRMSGTPVILDIHDILPELYAGKFSAQPDSMMFRQLLRVERLSCRFASHIIVANDIWRARLISRSVKPDKCTTVLNYPDLEVFVPAARKQGPGAASRPFVMLYPGSLNHHQGLHVAIRAVARVSDRIPMAELHIYGEGPAKPHLCELAAQLRVENKVVFHDPVPLEQIAEVMARADLGVEPKMADGFSGDAVSTKILEFMACGVPVVASRTAAHAHYFDESVLRFFPSGDDAALGELMVEAHDGLDGSRQRVPRARSFAAAYSWQNRSAHYFALVGALLPQSVKSGC